ncbi:hypothetical protein D0T12_29185 [Actinomadura spongiicola]|uniref:WD40 repeat domain-containing protein n=1 Tax=Actinomadura spongiicola TaxID=2303421 RepID=A0A372G9I6_9ACTN|nr:hypothetical protein [Actinomadura spongiicola]RFS81802.1 hypothetical protein D0T12_29185 [Actinomadura spongiicola]
MPESVQASPLAEGAFDGVAATSEGPPLAFASRTSHGANTGQLWDLTSGAVHGPPIPGFPAGRAEWTFGVPAASPIVAWTHRDRVHVHDLGTGGELVVDGQPDLLGLAAHSGRGAVVAVFGPACDAEVVVWDAATGDRLAEFTLWLGHHTDIDRSMLHATPASGPVVALTGGADVLVLDVERGGDAVTAVPSGRAVMAPSPHGLVLVEVAERALRVRGVDGDGLAVLTVPEPCGPVAASGAGPLLVAAALRDDPCAVLAWDAAEPDPSHRVKVPAPVHDLALAPDGTLVAATDDGLFAARLR